MNPSSMLSTVRENTRLHELASRELDCAVAQARDTETRLQSEIAACLHSIASLQIDHDVVTDRAVKDLLEIGAREEAALREQLAQAESDIAGQLAEKDRLLDQIAAVRQQAWQALAADEAFLKLQAERDGLLAAYQPQSSRYAEVQLECEEKLRAFESHAGYQYLVRAGYGTQDYRGGPLRRFFDDWIAGQCKFPDNRSNELMLRAMLQEIGVQEARHHNALSPLQQQMERLLRQAETAAGLPDLQGALDTVEAGVQRGKGRANAIQGRIAEHRDSKDSHFRKACRLVERGLKNKTLVELLEIAARTPDGVDDAAARQAARLQEQLARQKQQTLELQRRHSEANKAYERARELERRLDVPSYTSDSYQYRSGLDMPLLVSSYMLGTRSLQAVVKEVRRYREDIPREPSYTSSSSGHSNDWVWAIVAAAGSAVAGSREGRSRGLSRNSSSSSSSSGGDYETTYSL